MVLGERIYLAFMFTLPSPYTFWHDHCNHSDVNSPLVLQQAFPRSIIHAMKDVTQKSANTDEHIRDGEEATVGKAREDGRCEIPCLLKSDSLWSTNTSHEMSKHFHSDNAAWCLIVANYASIPEKMNMKRNQSKHYTDLSTTKKVQFELPQVWKE